MDPADLCVKVEELIDYMSGITLTASQREAAEDVLAGVQGELETWLNRPVVRRERTETVIPDDLGRLWPTATPILSVSLPVGLSVGAHMVTWGGWGGGFYEPTEITYVGGLDGTNISDIRLGIMRVAAREMEMRHDDTVTVKDLSSRNEGEKNSQVRIGWQDDELARLSRYKRRVVA